MVELWCRRCGEDVALGLLKLSSLSMSVALLRLEKGLVVSKMVQSKIPVEKFGSPHFRHSQVQLSVALKTASFMPMHS